MELTISQFLIIEVKSMVRASRHDAKAVLIGVNQEAVHDFRVSIRRLRSFLQTIKKLYYKGYMRLIQNSLKELADSTNDLRDLEITRQKLSKLNFSDEYSSFWQQWMEEMRQQENQLRSSFQERLLSGSALSALSQLEALLQLPIAQEKDIPAKEYSIEMCAAMRQEWLDRRRLMPHFYEDSQWLHNFRILSKKVRYVFSFYQKILPPAYQMTALEARILQNLLGEINDYYVIEKNLLTTELDKSFKEIVLFQLISERDKFRKKLKKMRPIQES